MSVLYYAMNHVLHCVFFTLCLKPIDRAIDGVDAISTTWRRFLRLRLVSITQADFDRLLGIYEKNLRESGASEEEIKKKLSRMRWHWRWFHFRTLFFSKGKEKSLSWFESQTRIDFKKDGREGKDFNSLFARELSHANQEIERWETLREEFEKKIREKLAKEKDGNMDEETIERIVKRRVRDRFCRVSGWIEAGVKRIEVKRSDIAPFFFHIHVLASVDVPLPNIILSLLWSKVAPGCYVTDIREIEIKELRRGTNAVGYASKIVDYSAKDGDEEFTFEQKMELQAAFYRRDLVSRIGWNQDGLKEYENEKPKRACRCCGAVGHLEHMGKCEPRDYEVGDVVHSTKYFSGGHRDEYYWRVIDKNDEGLILEKLDLHRLLWVPDRDGTHLIVLPDDAWKGG